MLLATLSLSLFAVLMAFPSYHKQLVTVHTSCSRLLRRWRYAMPFQLYMGFWKIFSDTIVHSQLMSSQCWPSWTKQHCFSYCVHASLVFLLCACIVRRAMNLILRFLSVDRHPSLYVPCHLHFGFDTECSMPSFGFPCARGEENAFTSMLSKRSSVLKYVLAHNWPSIGSSMR